jgi:galactonate dehydratase
MRIAKIEDFHADGGWRVFSFLKITTDEGLVGWSEYAESSWSRGLSGVIRKLAEPLIGMDPRPYGLISSRLRAYTRMAPGGLNDQAVAAIENALVDIAAKSMGVPVYALFGGPYREMLQLYWSHCGTFRVRNAELFERVIGTSPLRSLDDFKSLGREVTTRGFCYAKTNPILIENGTPRMLNPGFGPGVEVALNSDSHTLAGIVDQLAAFREGLGPDAGLMMDLNFSFKPESLIRISKAAENFSLTWLEMDVHDPAALAHVRRSSVTPIASLEAVYGRRNYRPYFEQQAVDVAVIDVPWNGMLESVRIAAMAEAYEVNVAPHNFYGHLSTMMSAHFCAAIPNFRIMEIEVDDVPWKDELVTHLPDIRDGKLVLPHRPGWGCEVNEEGVRAHTAPRP